MIGVRAKCKSSWLDPESAGLVGWKLGKRLWARIQGQKGVFLTLTYRHDEYADASELYRRSRERQDVPLFLRRLGRGLRRSFNGQWMCKLEFQQGGWVHFHVVLLGVDYIDHQTLSRCWGLGFVWVKRLNKKNCFYLTKYIAKGGRIPAWLYLERPKSVKIVRASKGFWGENTTKKTKAKDDYDRYGPGKSPTVDGYVCVGEKLSRRGIVVRAGSRVFSRAVDLGEFTLRLLRLGVRCAGRRDGWLWWNAGPGMVDEVAAACRWGAPERSLAKGGPAGMPPAGGLHLRGTSNPDADRLPWFIEAILQEDAEYGFAEAA